MKRLIDTSVLVDNLKTGVFEEGVLSVITLIEVLRGVPEEKRESVKSLLEESYGMLNLDNRTILAYCKLYSKLRRKGELVPDADLLLAATAIAHDLVLVTKDRHFERLEKYGLRVELRE
ncbi:MAG: type II toxin-antitoxin system VapC family toxin [Thermofilum sp.]|jgi:predicted nucleic acid-binding protein|uniref:PilT protein domain-containing protein n=1 Tax=Thermofilum adornatum 1505 TaxID=697581 RepID=A0A3G1A681_9CREN|nr:type II toxin-antitoxin system VapC family toxin [Thermofilum adornatum]AJB41613.1 PilT protein domain-containing protein [Thermofilum adornatum 1505]MCC5997767.1 type II toxin-antitoxin system VapC family toxin [Thermofilum sp.]